MALTRREKSAIRKEICMTLDRECRGCEFNKTNAFIGKNEQCEGCPVGIRLHVLSRNLVEDEKKKPNVTAKLSITSNFHGSWTEDEDFYLLHHYQLYDHVHLSKKFNRSPLSIKRRIIKLTSKEVVLT
jgi:hypothetical protein